MELYGRRSSINVQKVLWSLAELGKEEGRDFTRIDAGLQFGVVDTPEYRQLNPNGLVPTLVDGDYVLWESNTIVRYVLDTVEGGHALFPAVPKQRAHIEQWMDWQQSTLWATLRVVFLGLTRTPEPLRDYAAIKKAHADATRMLGVCESALAKHAYLCGSDFTAADLIVTLPVHRWYGLNAAFPEVLGTPAILPAVDEWYRRVIARPAFQRAVD